MSNNKKIKEKAKKTYTAPALEKGLDILELLADEKVPMTMPQISAALQRSKTEIYRMLTALEGRGYLSRAEGSDQFEITNKLFDLGMSASPVDTLMESAYPVMHELSEKIRQSSHLVVASGDRIVVIARVESSAVFGFSVKVGRYAGLVETTSGAVLLAWMPGNDRRQFLRSHAKQSKGFDVQAFETKLAAIRKRGWLQRKSPDVSGVTDISVPILQGESEHTIACLMVPFLRTSRMKVTLNEAREQIRQAAGEISSLAATYHGF